MSRRLKISAKREREEWTYLVISELAAAEEGLEEDHVAAAIRPLLELAQSARGLKSIPKPLISPLSRIDNLTMMLVEGAMVEDEEDEEAEYVVNEASLPRHDMSFDPSRHGAHGKIIQAGDGFVTYLNTGENLWLLMQAAASRSSEVWTLSESAFPGDLVVFYFMAPIHMFVAWGRVMHGTSDKWGTDRKPMAQIGDIHLFEHPVHRDVARRRLHHPWLEAPRGFGKGIKTGVDRIVELGGSSVAPFKLREKR